LDLEDEVKNPCSMMNVTMALTIGVVVMTIECIWWMFSLKKVIPPQILVSKKGKKEHKQKRLKC
jgi:hypothetical protein